jgi:hypothetical protein
MLSLGTMGLTTRKRYNVITRHEYTSLTKREIAEHLEVSLGAINKIFRLKKFDWFHLTSKEEMMWRKKTAFTNDVSQLRQRKTDPCKTSLNLQKDLATAGLQVPDYTVCHR